MSDYVDDTMEVVGETELDTISEGVMEDDTGVMQTTAEADDVIDDAMSGTEEILEYDEGDMDDIQQEDQDVGMEEEEDGLDDTNGVTIDSVGVKAGGGEVEVDVDAESAITPATLDIPIESTVSVSDPNPETFNLDNPNPDSPKPATPDMDYASTINIHEKPNYNDNIHMLGDHDKPPLEKEALFTEPSKDEIPDPERLIENEQPGEPEAQPEEQHQEQPELKAAVTDESTNTDRPEELPTGVTGTTITVTDAGLDVVGTDNSGGDNVISTGPTDSGHVDDGSTIRGGSSSSGSSSSSNANASSDVAKASTDNGAERLPGNIHDGSATTGASDVVHAIHDDETIVGNEQTVTASVADVSETATIHHENEPDASQADSEVNAVASAADSASDYVPSKSIDADVEPAATEGDASLRDPAGDWHERASSQNGELKEREDSELPFEATEALQGHEDAAAAELADNTTDYFTQSLDVDLSIPVLVYFTETDKTYVVSGEGTDYPSLFEDNNGPEILDYSLEELFALMRQSLEGFCSMDEELVLTCGQLGLALGEDNVCSRDATLSDLVRLFQTFAANTVDYERPSTFDLRLTLAQRFISKYNRLYSLAQQGHSLVDLPQLSQHVTQGFGTEHVANDIDFSGDVMSNAGAATNLGKEILSSNTAAIDDEAQVAEETSRKQEASLEFMKQAFSNSPRSSETETSQQEDLVEEIRPESRKRGPESEEDVEVEAKKVKEE